MHDTGISGNVIVMRGRRDLSELNQTDSQNVTGSKEPSTRTRGEDGHRDLAQCPLSSMEPTNDWSGSETWAGISWLGARSPVIRHHKMPRVTLGVDG